MESLSPTSSDAHVTDEEWAAMTPEQQAEVREVRPWDLIRPGVPRAPKAVAEERYAACKACPLFNDTMRVCTACGCLMKLKTHLAEAHCPEGRWGAIERIDA